MFTGIVEELGTVVDRSGPRLRISATTVLDDVAMGASIAVNGSSSRITLASCSITRANNARCACPPLSVSSARFSNPRSPTASSASRTAA